jgi:hypothetical protein
MNCPHCRKVIDLNRLSASDRARLAGDLEALEQKATVAGYLIVEPDEDGNERVQFVPVISTST